MRTALEMFLLLLCRLSVSASSCMDLTICHSVVANKKLHSLFVDLHKGEDTG